MDTKYKLFRTVGTEKVLYLPSKLIALYRLIEGDTITLRCGSASVTAKASVLDSPKSSEVSEIGLSDAVLRALNIPHGIFITVQSDGSHELRLGPLIGVLTFTQHIPSRLDYYFKYVFAKKNKGLIYVFSGQDIDVSRSAIRGCYYDFSAKAWQQRLFPFPDAVMDRCYPSSKKTHDLLAAVMGPGKIFNNTTRISKINFFKTVNNDIFLKKYLPATQLLRYPSDLNIFLLKYGSIFLKPVDSMKGKGIVVATQHKNGIECRFNSAGTDTIRTVASFADIPEILLTAAGRKRKYIMQQAVKCMEYGGGPFSFRTCPMKDESNRWLLPGMVVIGTMGNGHVTNYASGGRRIPLKDLFKIILPQLPNSKDEFLQLLEDITLKTASLLDDKFGPFGELGVDIILDKQGQPWLLEANANPARTPAFIQTEYPLWRKQVYEYIVGYANHLAGFGSRDM
ncbi:YheC/YheD family protein [Phosphitispora fastidiosa]|uniref:YheC/YheD family endospore coat-associated protein n=1 Tax=Phosphitispora fastidiosa TaxID=2837202 RepID=UPI001E3A8142|nr:YheC/YheD family protein [Phosphitispora fastidiosa]MBU7006227.1 glutathione synthase/RimK-type ligase-like ATP-grasp enzyme [Phosphitispora fastidiosa]